MHASIGSVLLLLGLFLVVVSQLSIAMYAFAGNPLQGLACLFIPLYVYVYARRHKAGVWLMRAWYAGIGLWVVGGVLAS